MVTIETPAITVQALQAQYLYEIQQLAEVQYRMAKLAHLARVNNAVLKTHCHLEVHGPQLFLFLSTLSKQELR
jgi:hypothetical protein